MILVTVGTIDRYGFLDRELHPSLEDEGKEGKLVGMNIEFEGMSIDDDDPVDEITFVTIEFPGGRRVELVEHEIDHMEVVV
jgi:hypothetical protein